MKITPEVASSLSYYHIDLEVLKNAEDYKPYWIQAGEKAAKRFAGYPPELIVLSGASAEISSIFLSSFVPNIENIQLVRFTALENWWIYKRFYGQSSPLTVMGSVSFRKEFTPPAEALSKKILANSPRLLDQIKVKCRIIDEASPTKILFLDDRRSTNGYKARKFPQHLKSQLKPEPEVESLFITGQSLLTDVLFHQLAFYEFIKSWGNVIKRIDTFSDLFDIKEIKEELRHVLIEIHEKTLKALKV